MRCYNAIFTVAQFLLNFVSFPVGILLDTTRKPLFFTLAGIFQFLGFVLFAVSDSKPSSSITMFHHRDYFILSYGLMALGGSMAIIGAFPASFLVRPIRYQALLLAANSCLFDASSVIFYVVYRLNLAFPYVFSRKRVFLGLAVLAFLIYTVLVICWILLEKKDWKTVCDREIDEINSEKEDNDAEDAHNSIHVDRDQNKTETSITTLHAKRIRDQKLHEISVYRQLASFEFTFIVIFSSIHVLQTNLYIETVNEYLASIGDINGTYAGIFSYLLPCGVVFIPLIDYTIQRVGAVNTLNLTNVLSMAFGSVLLLPNLVVQVMNFGLFTCFRAYLYSTINTYTAETFGVNTLGRIIGCIYTSSSIITLLQYPAASIAEGYFNDDFWVVYLSMLVFCLVPVVIAVWYCRIILKAGSVKDNERLSLING